MRDHRPRLSIGLPVFNGEKYLEETLISILNQTYDDFELLISDNASSDRTEEICRAFVDKDKRLRYFRNDRNLGAAPNYNRVFGLSSGEFFKWHAYDDLIVPDFISKCVEVLDDRPEVLLCFPQVTLIDGKSKVIGDYNFGSETNSTEPHIRFQRIVLRHGYFVPSFGLIRTDSLRQTSGHQSFPSSDKVLLAELALRGRFYEIPERLFLLRIHEQKSTKGSLSIERARALWFDTSLKGKIFFPKWAYCHACLGAIKNAPINHFQRLLCYAQMMHWCLVPAHLRAMGKDILLAADQMIVRFASGQASISTQH